MRARAINFARRRYLSAHVQAYFLLGFAGVAFACSPCQAQGSAQPAQRSQSKHIGDGPQAKTESSARPPFNYDEVVQRAKALVVVRPEEARLLCKQAIQKDPSRYEAHVISAAALRQQMDYVHAVVHLRIAIALAPDERKPTLSRAITETRLAALSADGKRQLDALKLTLRDVSETNNRGDYVRLLKEFMVSSASFLDDYPFVPELWLLRAEGSLELDYPELGWIAGNKLTELGLADSADPAIREVMAQLERKKWVNHKFRSDAASGYTPQEMIRLDPLNDSTGYQSREDSVAYGMALRYYRQGAAMGEARSAYYLGLMYAEGWGVTKDDVQALEWFHIAASRGFSDSQIVMGDSYLSGYGGLRVDAAEGVRWYRRAAAQENAMAEEALARAYRHGTGVAQDGSEALHWYRSAAGHALPPHYRSPLLPNNLAWMFATDPDSQYRDGAEAVRLASGLCEGLSFLASCRQTYNYVDTLAAAYAEMGDWEKAVATEEKAIRGLEQLKDADSNTLAGFRERLGLYKSSQPFRQPIKQP